MSSFHKRKKALEDLITKRAIRNQEELITLLKEEYHIETTQTVVSRDLKMMGCVKTIQDNQRIYTLPRHNTQQKLLHLAIKEIQFNETMIVVHTEGGLASFVGDMIDQKCLEIMGTVSGENVVFVAPKSIHHIADIVLSLKKLAGLVEDEKNE